MGIRPAARVAGAGAEDRQRGHSEDDERGCERSAKSNQAASASWHLAAPDPIPKNKQR
jgi:hypothetical protein